MLNTQTARKIEIPDHLCYYCNEGHCAQCSGWDRTVINGEVVLVACAHECRSQRKPMQKANEPRTASKRRA